jgi:hypothetical protein
MTEQEQDSKVKKQDYRKWVEGQSAEALEKELRTLESRRTNLRHEEEEIDQPESDTPLWRCRDVKRQLAEATRCIEAVQRDLTARRVHELSKGEAVPASAGIHKHHQTSPVVAARRAVVLANIGQPAPYICEVLDSEHINLPPDADWEPYRSHKQPWTDAYRLGGEKLRRRIRSIFSRDKKDKKA